jgi:hypothetical protein
MTEDDVVALARILRELTPSQRDWVREAMRQFGLPHKFIRRRDSDWISEDVLQHIGDALRIHHALSRQPLSKDRFEYAFERALNLAGISAKLVVSRTNPGHDMTIAEVPVSLKSEAAANIKENVVHVSKWMELGKGEWDLGKLRDRFLEHLKSYERIFTLRCLLRGPKDFFYELVEIPKALMLEAKDCRFESMNNSNQNPKPGYGYVYDSKGALKFALYFDGGTERKLQVKQIKKNLCVTHASWQFESAPLQ